jgi:hypothetical protein
MVCPGDAVELVRSFAELPGSVERRTLLVQCTPADPKSSALTLVACDWVDAQIFSKVLNSDFEIASPKDQMCEDHG